MTPMDITPKGKRPPDGLLHSPKPPETTSLHKCRREGCSGTVNLETGRCGVCGMMYGKLQHQTLQKQTTSRISGVGKSTLPVAPPESTPSGKSNQASRKSTQPQQVQPAVAARIDPTHRSSTSSLGTTLLKRALEVETPYRRSSLRLPKVSLPETTRWWLIRGAVIFILLAVSVPAIVYYLRHSSLPETPTSAAGSSPNLPAFSPPAYAPAYTFNISVATQGGRVRISDGDERICEPGKPFSEQYKPGTKITVTAIPEEGWKFQRWDGYSSNSNFMTITITKPVTIMAHFEDVAPPRILHFDVAKVTEVCAHISWQTAEPIAAYEIKYGKQPDCELPGPSGEHNGTSYSAKITGLEPDTSYFYRITLKDASGIPTTSETKKFTTLSPLPAQVGNRAPDFALPNLVDNSLVTLSDFHGKKVLLNLWATNCPGCVLELPYIQAIHESREEVAVVTVCLDKNVDRIHSFCDKHPELTFLILVNQPSITSENYRIRVMPTTFFIDRQGIIRAIESGSFKSLEEIEAILKSIE